MFFNALKALTSGTPFVGYEGVFARDLISPNGGGVLVSVNDVAGLTEQVIIILRDPKQLVEVTHSATADDVTYDKVSVYHHRSELIQKLIPPNLTDVIGLFVLYQPHLAPA